MMKRTTLLLLISFILVATLLPACGTKPLLKIGLALPFTGYDQDRGYNAIYAVKQAIAETNERGGVGGCMIELVAVDDRNDPAEAARQARELTLYDDLVGVIGHYDDECTRAAIPAYRRAGLALVAPWLTAEDDLPLAPVPRAGEPGNFVFRLAAPASALGGQLATWSGGWSRVAVLTDDSPAGRELAVAFTAGQTVVCQAEVCRGQRDFAALARQVADARPGAVFYSGHATEAALLLLALRAAGVTAPFLGGSDLDDPKFVRLAGAAADGVVFVGLARPGGEPLAAGYRARTGRDPDGRAALACDATRLLLAAIEHAAHRDGRPTRQGVARSLGELTHARPSMAGVIYTIAGGAIRPW